MIAMEVLERKKVLVPDRVYEVGLDCPFGYYLFSNYLEYDKDTPPSHKPIDAEFHMYETYPPDSWHTYERGYFGFAYVRQGQKFIRLESGAAIYFGDMPFNLYEVLTSADLSDGIFYSEGVTVLSNKLCTIKIFKRDRANYIYHGDSDAVLSDQFLYSINGHNFWAGILNVETYKSYNSVIFGLRDISTETQYKFGDKELRVKGITNLTCSIEDEPLRLYKGAGKDYIAIEIPKQVSMDSVDIEWVKPSCCSKKLYCASADIKQIYSEDLSKLAVVLQKYSNIGLNLDIKKELEYFKKAPDFIHKCSDFLEKSLRDKSQFDSKVKDDSLRFTFHVGATYDKRFYCAAKLADDACDVQVNSDGTVYYVSFTGSQIEEISLMYYDLVSMYNTERSDLAAAAEYLEESDYYTYLQNAINTFISDLQTKSGYSSFITNSVLISIIKAINRDKRRKLNKLYSAMAHENRISTKWSTEYKLYVIVSKLVCDATYQHRTDWLGLQSFDIFIPSQNIAIEYQGQQHYEAVDVFGGEAALFENRKRDARKRAFSAEHGVRVLDWKFDLPVDEENVRHFLTENMVEFNIPSYQSPVKEMQSYGIEMAPVKAVEQLKQERIKLISPFVIRKYSENGTFIREYFSVSEAMAEAGISEKSINNVIYNIRKTGGGYIWRRCKRGSNIENVQPVNLSKNTGLAKSVVQVSATGEKIAVYASIGKAAKATGVNRRSISDALSGVQKTGGGYIWLFTGDAKAMS